MFTGIIEASGRVQKIIAREGNKTFTISAPFAASLVPGQSVAHNGVCLTVTNCSAKNYDVTAVAETLSVTNLSQLNVDDKINLERALQAGARMDGHFVQGHVDDMGTILKVSEENGSHRFTISFPDAAAALLIHKGSIALNGVSLTVASLTKDSFSVVIIPHTFENTNFRSLHEGDAVNIEFDMLGKYVATRQR